MQKADDLIKDLYNGEIYPAEKPIKKDSKYYKLHLEIIKMKEDLYKEYPDGKLEKKVERLTEKFTELHGLYNDEIFKDGFSLGVQLIIEAYKND
ncbi:MAG: hypothetical protein R3Y35_14345 [Clostridia bacterium]